MGFSFFSEELIFEKKSSKQQISAEKLQLLNFVILNDSKQLFPIFKSKLLIKILDLIGVHHQASFYHLDNVLAVYARRVHFGVQRQQHIRQNLKRDARKLHKLRVQPPQITLISIEFKKVFVVLILNQRVEIPFAHHPPQLALDVFDRVEVEEPLPQHHLLVVLQHFLIVPAPLLLQIVKPGFQNIVLELAGRGFYKILNYVLPLLQVVLPELELQIALLGFFVQKHDGGLADVAELGDAVVVEHHIPAEAVALEVRHVVLFDLRVVEEQSSRV